eukprot:403369318
MTSQSPQSNIHMNQHSISQLTLLSQLDQSDSKANINKDSNLHNVEIGQLNNQSSQLSSISQTLLESQQNISTKQNMDELQRSLQNQLDLSQNHQQENNSLPQSNTCDDVLNHDSDEEVEILCIIRKEFPAQIQMTNQDPQRESSQISKNIQNIADQIQVTQNLTMEPVEQKIGVIEQLVRVKLRAHLYNDYFSHFPNPILDAIEKLIGFLQSKNQIKSSLQKKLRVQNICNSITNLDEEHPNFNKLRNFVRKISIEEYYPKNWFHNSTRPNFASFSTLGTGIYNSKMKFYSAILYNFLKPYQKTRTFKIFITLKTYKKSPKVRVFRNPGKGSAQDTRPQLPLKPNNLMH